MRNRFAQILFLVLGLGFGFAALAGFHEPWGTMNEAVVAEVLCGHLLGLVFSAGCFQLAMRFGTRAAYSKAKRLRQRYL